MRLDECLRTMGWSGPRASSRMDSARRSSSSASSYLPCTCISAARFARDSATCHHHTAPRVIHIASITNSKILNLM